MVAAFVVATVYGAMMLLGLPDWVFPAGAVLMLAGLPIVLYAEHADRTRSAMTAVEGSNLTGLKAWLTMQRAAKGGIFAISGLVLVTAGFTVFRALGVGPFATLVSSGAIAEQSVIVLAPFENRTDDPALGTTVTVALQVDLAQSSLVALMGDSRIRSALTRMELDEDTPITDEIAREIAIPGVPAHRRGVGGNPSNRELMSGTDGRRPAVLFLIRWRSPVFPARTVHPVRKPVGGVSAGSQMARLPNRAPVRQLPGCCRPAC